MRFLGRVGVDAALAAVVLVAELGPMLAGGPPWSQRDPTAMDLARILGISLPLLVRRQFPVPVLALGVASFWGSDLLGFGLLITLYSVGAWCERPWLSRVAGPVAAVAISVALVRYRNVAFPVEFLIPLTGFVTAWFLGHVIHQRRHYTGRLEERTHLLEAERAESERRAAAAERARIARDLHDIVAHRVSMITVQAGAARVVADTDPDATRRAITLIEEAGRQTLWELRRLVGVLRADDEPAAPVGPRPDLRRLDELTADVERAGVPVRLTIIGDAAHVPEAVQVSAYRIVQEALTNVVKHAGSGAEADVIVRCSNDAVELEITDTGDEARTGAKPPSGGHGIVGMRERAAAFGGTVDAGPRPEGGFRVRARLRTAQGAS